MKKWILRTFVWVFILAVPASLWAVEGSMNPEKNYRIGSGDILEISVWKDEALTRMVTVRPDGMISFPLVGEVTAEGKTVAVLKSEMAQLISRFIPEPILSVDVRQVNSLQIFVVGKAVRPGRFVYSGDLNVMQALAMAGGLNPFARRDRIKIFREKNGETSVIDFNYDVVASGENLPMNISLARGDVIVVP